MELKPRTVGLPGASSVVLIVPFMELKLPWSRTLYAFRLVLIVPFMELKRSSYKQSMKGQPS